MNVSYQFLNSKVAKFLLVGGTATLIQFIMLCILIEYVTNEKVVSAVLAYSLSTIYNYIMSYTYTFSASNNHSTALPKFLFIALLGLVFNTMIFTLFSEVIGIHYLIAQFIATCCVLVWNFVMNNCWSFNDKKEHAK